jgi:hypothetical protein
MIYSIGLKMVLTWLRMLLCFLGMITPMTKHLMSSDASNHYDTVDEDAYYQPVQLPFPPSHRRIETKHSRIDQPARVKGGWCGCIHCLDVILEVELCTSCVTGEHRGDPREKYQVPRSHAKKFQIQKGQRNGKKSRNRTLTDEPIIVHHLLEVLCGKRSVTNYDLRSSGNED